MHKIADDAELTLQAQQGDRLAFETLYDRYFERIYDFAYQLVRNPDDAADVTSETFLKAMQKIDGLRDPQAFRGWLYAIARNAALSLLGRRKKTTAMPEDFEPMAPTPTDAPSTPAPEAGVEQAELRQLVWEAAATLNPRDYSIFDMLVRQGLDSAEVAEALGVKPSHAYVLVSRLKDSVEDALGAVVLVRAGRKDCPDLDTLVTKYGDERTPKMRKAVVRHMKACETCAEGRKRYASAAVLLGGVAAAAPAAGLREELRTQLLNAWDQMGPGSGGGGPNLWRTVPIALAGALAIVLFVGRSVTDPGSLLTTEAAFEATPTPVVADAAGPPDPAPASTPTGATLGTPPPAAGPTVQIAVADALLYTDGRCGDRTTSVTATVQALPGVASAVMNVTKDNSTSSRTMVRSPGGGYRATLGPFSSPGTANVWVVVTDGAGRRTRSGTRSVPVRDCPQPTATPEVTEPVDCRRNPNDPRCTQTGPSQTQPGLE